MIVAGTDKYIWIDLGRDEEGMTLQRFDRGVWRDYLVDGVPQPAPVDIEKLPADKYRLRTW